MQDEIQRELETMQRCAEAIGCLDHAAQTRVLNWLSESFTPENTTPATESSRSAPSQIQQHLQSQTFRRLATGQEKFLSILDLLRQLHSDPEQFLEIACAVSGRRRRYFARTRQEIEDSGRGANAVRISRSYPLYADCNNSTESKRQILRKLMAALGRYEEDDIEAAAAAIQ